MRYYKETKELRDILYQYGSFHVKAMAHNGKKYGNYLDDERGQGKTYDIWRDIGRFMTKLAAREGNSLNIVMRENLNQTERNAIQYMFDTIG